MKTPEDSARISAEDFIQSATHIVDEAQKRGIILRIMGAVACRIHTPELADLHTRLKRLNQSGREFTDLDLITYNKFSSKLEEFFNTLGYLADEHAKYQIHVWAQRHFYREPKGRFNIDVFFDKLDMSHTIDFKNRLERDYPTIPLAELLLEKMQIVNINEKDIKDTIIILLGHEVADDDENKINGKFVASLLAGDWGLWYTTTMNLDKVKSFASRYEQLSENEKSYLNSKIDILRRYIDKAPKGAKWNWRARIGTKRRWYKEVEERYTSAE